MTVLLVLSVLFGALLGKYFGNRQILAKNLLVLSAGFLITICLNEVFPEVYSSGKSNLGVFVIGGVLLQMLLEGLTKGFEHGHLHHHHDEKHILPMALLAGLFVHAFLEGIPLANLNGIASPYLLGIVVHNLPISFILGAFLFGGTRKMFSWAVILLFASASPMGAIFGKFFDPDWNDYFLAVVGGIFLHISSVIIFESDKNHNVAIKKILWVIAGILLALGGHLYHDH